MTDINQLSALSSVSAGDQVPVWSTGNGDTRKAAVSVLQDYMQDNLTFPSAGIPDYTTQNFAPNMSGLSVTITGTAWVWLLVTPIAGYAAMTIVMPTAPVDKQEVMVNCTQSVTTLTISSVRSVNGAPTTLAANAFFRLKYDATLLSWYRVG